MNLSKKTSLILLAIIALLGSRAMFFFIDDPEGPNLLIVTVTALVVYSLSLVAFRSGVSPSKKLPLAIVVQLVLLALGAYFG